jgi:hypothetical protein
MNTADISSRSLGKILWQPANSQFRSVLSKRQDRDPEKRDYYCATFHTDLIPKAGVPNLESLFTGQPTWLYEVECRYAAKFDWDESYGIKTDFTSARPKSGVRGRFVTTCRCQQGRTVDRTEISFKVGAAGHAMKKPVSKTQVVTTE